MQFTPIQEFQCKETGSVYVPGLSYTVDDGNVGLVARVEKWLWDGKVRLSVSVSEVSGLGKVE